MKKPLLCEDCKPPALGAKAKHTNPPGKDLCQCSDPRCACGGYAKRYPERVK